MFYTVQSVEVEAAALFLQTSSLKWDLIVCVLAGVRQS